MTLEKTINSNETINVKPICTPEGQTIPTCGVCEKILIAQMREKYSLFNATYSLGHTALNLWMRMNLPKEVMNSEENNAVRKCRTCEKVYYRQMRAKSKKFDGFYKLMDATIEGWIAKFLTDEDKEKAFNKDPIHAKELMKFNPRSYYRGENFILGIKFDGCIAKETENGFPDTIGEPMPGIKEKLQELKSNDVKIVIYGWRSNEHTKGNPTYRKQAEHWMKENQIPYDFFYDGKGPIIADAFISNRNLGGSLEIAYDKITSMANDPEKQYLKTRHIL